MESSDIPCVIPSLWHLQSHAPSPLPGGVWHVHELAMDHFAVCGGPLASARCADEFWATYLRVRAQFGGGGDALCEACRE